MLTTVAKNKLLTAIVTDINSVSVVEDALNDITVASLISTMINPAYPTRVVLTWGTASGGVIKTTNKPQDSNPINFSLEQGAEPRKVIYFTNGSSYPLIVENVSSGVPLTYTNQGPYYIREYQLTITEV